MRLIDADAMAESLNHDVELDARALDNMDLVGQEREQIQFDKDCKQNCLWYLTEQPTIFAPRWVSVEDEMPKSGTHVLACCEVHGINGYKGHYVCDAFHTDKKSIPCSYNDDIDEEYDEETDEYYFPEGWWEVIKNWDDYSCVAISDFVTHWMPLPELPKEDV